MLRSHSSDGGGTRCGGRSQAKSNLAAGMSHVCFKSTNVAWRRTGGTGWYVRTEDVVLRKTSPCEEYDVLRGQILNLKI